METLCKEARAIAKRKRVGKEELFAVIEKAEKEYLDMKKELEIHCNACLRGRVKQKKLDEEAYNRSLMRNTIKNLSHIESCEHCNTAYDEDISCCVDCGTVLCNGIIQS